MPFERWDLRARLVFPAPTPVPTLNGLPGSAISSGVSSARLRRGVTGSFFAIEMRDREAGKSALRHRDRSQVRFGSRHPVSHR